MTWTVRLSRDAARQLRRLPQDQQALICDRRECREPLSSIKETSCCPHSWRTTSNRVSSTYGLAPDLQPPGALVLNDGEPADEATQHLQWRRWLHLYNTFQTLAGVLLATTAGLHHHDYESILLAATSHGGDTAHRCDLTGLGARARAGYCRRSKRACTRSWSGCPATRRGGV